MNDIVIVSNEAELEIYAQAVANSTLLAIDTEFIRRSTYFARLSLVQIATSDSHVFFLDFIAHSHLALKGLDILYLSSAVKVFHSAYNDLELFYNLKGCLPQNIFDTQIANMAIGPNPNISYAQLIQAILGKKISKSQTLSDWLKRPLTSKQTQYAAYDVIWLRQAYPIITKRLRDLHREDWVSDRMGKLYWANNYKFDLIKFFSKFVVAHKISKNYELLAALLTWREKTAATRNVPRNVIAEDQNIKDITLGKTKAHGAPRKNPIPSEVVAELQTQKNQFNWAEPAAKAAQAAAAQPKHPLTELCYALGLTVAKHHNIAVELLLNKNVLAEFLQIQTADAVSDAAPKAAPATAPDAIPKAAPPPCKDQNPRESKEAQERPESPKSEAEEYFQVPWRYKLFTHQLLLFLEGKVGVKIQGQGLVFVNCGSS